ncbi:c-type cytochrome [Massilia sp. IC2-477]|uniref:c-type cytochrome n=1 Tax=Massilia sp. IC2-477 TaxID=2887198 RepID=UPI001D0F763B|nr:c-type cytochrome [Massilia sp. IC2-477]MCC2957572.1 c-type cytochrome [Massilia sp. IC2-477]
MEARVAACIGCHGKAGRGVANVYFPRLAGKPAGYLYHQLLAFRDGRRKYVPMNYLLAYLPDAYLYKMAQYFAAQDPGAFPQAAPAPSGQALEAGRRIATGGIPERGVPACASCHGDELAGREPGIPGLLGLRADYLSAQLGAWRYGVRTALAPDCMQLVAARLDEAEVAAVSAWLASRPVTRTRPTPRTGRALPLPCGGQDAPLPVPRP